MPILISRFSMSCGGQEQDYFFLVMESPAAFYALFAILAKLEAPLAKLLTTTFSGIRKRPIRYYN